MRDIVHASRDCSDPVAAAIIEVFDYIHSVALELSVETLMMVYLRDRRGIESIRCISRRSQLFSGEPERGASSFNIQPFRFLKESSCSESGFQGKAVLSHMLEAQNFTESHHTAILGYSGY
jgi:hypothetical protein